MVIVLSSFLQGRGPFAAAIAGAVKDRERRLEERRKSTVFLSVGTLEGSGSGAPAEPAAADVPSLIQSRSVDERMLTREQQVPLPPPPPALALRPAPGGTTFIHPLTGKPLDPSSPLALALAARERALSSQAQSPASSPEPRTTLEFHHAEHAHTKEPERAQAGRDSPSALYPAASKVQWASPASLRREMELERRDARTPPPAAEDKRSMLISVMDMSQQKTAGLVMVHATSNGQAAGLTQDEPVRASPTEPKPAPSASSPDATSAPAAGTGTSTPTRAQTPTSTPTPAPQPPPSPASDKTLAQGSSEEDVDTYGSVALPPAMLSSSDEETREELRKIGVVPPPDEFANGLLAKGQPAATAGPVGAAGSGATALPTATKPPPAKTPSAPPPPPSPLAPSTAGVTPPSTLTPAPAAVSGKPSEGQLVAESAADSGVEEVDTRSSSDHHLETTSTISTVSSMSTLSSESGEPTADTYSSHADGHTFVLDKPPVPPKPKLKSQLSKGPVTFRDPLLKQSSDSELLSHQQASALAAVAAASASASQASSTSGLGLGLGLGMTGLGPGPSRPRYLFQRRSKLWGDGGEARGGGSPSPEEGKPTVISELSSRLQQLNKDTRSLGEEPLGGATLGGALDPGRKSPIAGAR